MPYGLRMSKKDLRLVVFESIPFASTCPKCQVQRAQLGSRTALQKLLDHGHPVEAFCEVCDEHWPISPRERAEVARYI